MSRDSSSRVGGSDSAGPPFVEPVPWNRPLVSVDAERNRSSSARKRKTSTVAGNQGYGYRLIRGFGMLQSDRDD